MQPSPTTPDDPDDATLAELVGRLSLEQKVRLLTGADFWALHPEPAVGLRRVVTSDGPAGVRGELWDERSTSANVPSPTALAASFDVELVHRIGGLLAAEARRKGVDVLLAPTVNLHRSPYGGRHFECLSEDPLLTAGIGAAYVRGVQDGGVAATVKHFVANDSETERFTYDARVDETTLREVYLTPFEVIVREAGAWAVMAAYNAVDGATMTENPLLRSVLKDEWGFDGVVMSDWFATRNTKGAGRAALDLAMPGPTSPWGDALVTAVRAGDVDESAIDDKVARLLRLAARVGALDGFAAARPQPEPMTPAGVSAQLRAAAAAGFVLVRNEPVAGDADVPLLPLSGTPSVAVLGPSAAVARTLGGGSATVFPPHTVSPLDGLRDALGTDRVTTSPGVRLTDRPSVARAPWITDPETGEPGISDRVLDGSGVELLVEHRPSGAYTAQGFFGEGVDASTVAAVELRARLTARGAGSYRVGASGLGRVQVSADGRELVTARLALPEGADLAASLNPPYQTADLDLDDGQVVELVLHLGLDAENAVDTRVNLLVEPPHPPEDEELERAVAAAAAADVAVVVVGTTEEVESEGFDRETLALPGRQDELVRRVLAANPRTVVVVNSGAPVLLPWADQVPAVLVTWFPGQEFGAALADVLLGLAEPGGRLPVSWPAAEEGLPSTQPVEGVLEYVEGLFVGYRGYDRDGREPLFAFGAGQGYTTWGPASLQVERAGDGARATVRLRNSGGRPGREVVQLWAHADGSGTGRPARWLAGFATAHAGAGEEVSVEVTVPPQALRRWDADAGGWAPVGPVRLTVGPDGTVSAELAG